MQTRGSTHSPVEGQELAYGAGVSRPVTFLLSSAGRRGELVTILRQVGEEIGRPARVVAVDASPYTSAGWMCDDLRVVPRVTDPSFADRVLEVCDDIEVDHLVPTIDPELPVYAEHRKRFLDAGVVPWISSQETVRIAQNKRLTNEWLRQGAFPTVGQRDLTDALADRELRFPVVAKPNGGSASLGLVVVRSRDQLALLDASLDYVVEDVAPGVEHTVDVLVDGSGTCVTAIPRRRLEVRAGEVSKGLTVDDAYLVGVAIEIAESLPGAFGPLNIQMFYDETTSTLNVIEINARFGGGFPLSWNAGAHLPTWLVQHLAGEEPSPHLLRWAPDQVMLRYDQGVYVDLATLRGATGGSHG